MAELPLKVHLTSHPICLRICGPLMYEDENQRTWHHFIMGTAGDLKVRLWQVNIPRRHLALATSLLTSKTMPTIWTLHLGSQYLDSMGQFWRIVHHVKEEVMEEMILELMDKS